MSFKLPVWKIIEASFRSIGERKNDFLSALKIPSLLFTAALLLSLFLDKTGFSNPILITLLMVFIYAKFAVTCHRIIILDTNYRPPLLVSKCELIFLFWAVVLYMMTKIFGLLILQLIMLAKLDIGVLQPILTIVMLISSILSYYLLARFCLILPATAVEKSVNMRWAWNVSQGNGWRLTVLVGLLPVFLSFLVGGLSTIASTSSHSYISSLEKLGIFITYLFTLMVGIIALSYAYKAFETYYTKDD